MSPHRPHSALLIPDDEASIDDGTSLDNDLLAYEASAANEASVDATTANHAPQPKALLTGSRLRSYTFALLAKRDYSQGELQNKLLPLAANPLEVAALLEELVLRDYQSDQRVAEQTLHSQLRQGKGWAQIQQKLKQKQLDPELVATELADVDWLAQAYALKCRKFGSAVEIDAKRKAKQVRFLQYRGFDLNVCFAAISKVADLDDETK